MKKIPSMVTLVRLLLIPVIIYLIIKEDIVLALTLFLVAVISDKVDGYLARKLKQESYHGGVFDALTDTIMIFSIAATLYIQDYLSIVILFILLIPKVITFILLATINKKTYKPTVYSRSTSVILYITLILALIKTDNAIIFLLVLALYILSFIHWIKLVKIR